MRTPIFVAKFIFFTLLLAACGRDESGIDMKTTETPSAETQTPPSPKADTTIPAPPSVASDPSQPPAPPAPIVEGMYVIYNCDDGTEPRITFSGNLVKVELTADSKSVVLSARASSTNMSDTYSDETLTLHRDGLGITLDRGGGKTTRCTELEASV